MRVEKQTDSQLRLLREPTFLSKAVFVGFFVGLIGIFLFGSESFIFKVLIGLCAAGLSCLIVDNYEICEFDKMRSEVRMTRLHWCQYMLNTLISIGSPPYVKAKLEDIKDVRVEEQGGPTGGKAYQVILSMDTGVQLGVTEVFTTDDISEHEGIAQLIRSFLGDLSPLGIEDEADDEQEEVSSSEDDFEQISQADLAGIDEDVTHGAGDAAAADACGDKVEETPAEPECENESVLETTS